VHAWCAAQAQTRRDEVRLSHVRRRCNARGRAVARRCVRWAEARPRKRGYGRRARRRGNVCAQRLGDTLRAYAENACVRENGAMKAVPPPQCQWATGWGVFGDFARPRPARHACA